MQRRGVPLLGQSHRTPPFKVRLKGATAEIGVHKGHGHVASVANQVDEACTGVKRSQLRYDCNIGRRLVAEARLAGAPQVLAIWQVDQIGNPRRGEAGDAGAHVGGINVQVGPAVMGNDDLNRFGNLFGRQRQFDRKALDQILDEPGFRRNVQARMSAQDQPQQGRAGSAAADDKKRRVSSGWFWYRHASPPPSD